MAKNIKRKVSKQKEYSWNVSVTSKSTLEHSRDTISKVNTELDFINTLSMSENH